ncbi:hypothetical protein ACHAXT_001907 [Thalassiosira profunda]
MTGLPGASRRRGRLAIRARHGALGVIVAVLVLAALRSTRVGPISQFAVQLESILFEANGTHEVTSANNDSAYHFLRIGNDAKQRSSFNGTTADALDAPTRNVADTTTNSSTSTAPATNWTDYFQRFVHNVATHWESFSPPTPIPQTNASTQSDCVPASLILFGVPKEFDRIWRNYVKYIVRRNPNIRFEVHMHMYSDLHLKSFTNAKNDEVNVTVVSPSGVQEVLGGNISVQGEDGNASIPTRIVTSSQREYDEAGLSWMEVGDLRHFVFTNLDVLRNVFRQGNSMRRAYESAVSRPFLGNATGGRTFIFLRSDTLLVGDVDIPCAGLAANEVHAPSWQTKNFPELNDRAAVAGSMAAYKYARAKSDAFREMILDRRTPGEERHAWSSAKRMKEVLDKKTRKEITYNNVKDRPTLHNPEKMLNFYLHYDELDGPRLKVVERDENWMKLIRVRAFGKLADGGRWKVKAQYLNETDLR